MASREISTPKQLLLNRTPLQVKHNVLDTIREPLRAYMLSATTQEYKTRPQICRGFLTALSES
jgi:hypothetical protein